MTDNRLFERQTYLYLEDVNARLLRRKVAWLQLKEVVHRDTHEILLEENKCCDLRGTPELFCEIKTAYVAAERSIEKFIDEKIAETDNFIARNDAELQKLTQEVIEA